MKSKWKVDITPPAIKDIAALDRQTRARIEKDIALKLSVNPDKFLIPLVGKFGGTYKFRVGDYRLLCKKETDKLLILVVEVGHRKEIYKTK